MQKLLMGLLGINALLQLAVSALLLARPAHAVPAMFGVAYTDGARMLCAALGVAVAMSAVLLALATGWTRRGDAKGLQLAVLFGVWSCAAGAIFLWVFEQPGGAFDLLRGAVIVGLSLACARGLRQRARTPLAGNNID